MLVLFCPTDSQRQSRIDSSREAKLHYAELDKGGKGVREEEAEHSTEILVGFCKQKKLENEQTKQHREKNELRQLVKIQSTEYF
jgi:hypothetical protein